MPRGAASRRSGRVPRSTICSISGSPLVTVPVLSSRTVVAAPRRSRTPAPLTMIPARAARDSPATNAIGAARISGQGVATTITASHLLGSPVAAHARPPTTSEKGRKTAAYRSASLVNFARSLSAVRTSRTIAAYALSAADRVTRASNAFPAFMVPDRTSPPTGIVTGSASPVSADSSTTACVFATTPSAGTISPARTTTRSPGESASTGTSSTPDGTVAMGDPRRPLDQEPQLAAGPAGRPRLERRAAGHHQRDDRGASCSPRISAPAIATSAIASTPTSPRSEAAERVDDQRDEDDRGAETPGGVRPAGLVEQPEDAARDDGCERDDRERALSHVRSADRCGDGRTPVRPVGRSSPRTSRRHRARRRDRLGHGHRARDGPRLHPRIHPLRNGSLERGTEESAS